MPVVDSKASDLSVAAAVFVVAAAPMAVAAAAVTGFQVESQVDLLIAIDSDVVPVRD